MEGIRPHPWPEEPILKTLTGLAAQQFVEGATSRVQIGHAHSHNLQGQEREGQRVPPHFRPRIPRQNERPHQQVVKVALTHSFSVITL